MTERETVASLLEHLIVVALWPYLAARYVNFVVHSDVQLLASSLKD